MTGARLAAWLVVLLGVPAGMLAAGEHGPEPVAPVSKPHERQPELVELGRMLFHDRRFSRNDTVSCAHCHPLASGGMDNLEVSVGIEGRLGKINAPTVYNTGSHVAWFWDGRADTLEDLALEGPLQNPDEMGTSWEELIPKLQADPELVARFRKLFPDGLTPRNVSHAVAAFMRSLVTVDSPFDRWLRGEGKAIDAQQKRGYRLFKSYGCIACHQGVGVGGNMYANMGVMGDYFADRGGPITSADLGRFNVTGRESDRHVFKVPSLRMVALTAPYLHDGSAETLEEAVNIMARYQLGRQLPEKDVRDIVAFLRSLAGRHPLLEKHP